MIRGKGRHVPYVELQEVHFTEVLYIPTPFHILNPRGSGIDGVEDHDAMLFLLGNGDVMIRWRDKDDPNQSDDGMPDVVVKELRVEWYLIARGESLNPSVQGTMDDFERVERERKQRGGM